MLYELHELYCHWVNLDERGEYSATVYECVDDNSDNDIELWSYDQDQLSQLCEDGYMKYKGDLDGLLEYLQTVGIIKSKRADLIER